MTLSAIRFALLVPLLALLPAGRPALAQPIPGGEVAEGRALAREWCAACHDVEPAGRGAPLAEPSLLPRFADVAQDPSFTRLAFGVFLQTPHGGMPDFIVPPEQAADLYAYISSLKQP